MHPLGLVYLLFPTYLYSGFGHQAHGHARAYLPIYQLRLFIRDDAQRFPHVISCLACTSIIIMM